MILKTRDKYAPNGDHSGIIIPVLHIKETLPIEIKVIHIFGHQDDCVAF